MLVALDANRFPRDQIRLVLNRVPRSQSTEIGELERVLAIPVALSLRATRVDELLTGGDQVRPRRFTGESSSSLQRLTMVPTSERLQITPGNARSDKAKLFACSLGRIWRNC